MTAARTHRWLWFDCETTHTDPTQGAMLEWALVLAADDELGDHSPVEQYTGVLHFGAEAHAQWRADGLIYDFVEDMHTKNGLWAECAAASPGANAEADEFLAEMAAELRGENPLLLRLAGNSVHFDLAWCRVHLPRFAAHLSHRVGNVSALRDFATAWGVTVPATPFPERRRALEYVRASLALAQACREAFGARPRLVKRVSADLLPDEYLIPHDALVPDLARIEREGWAAEDTLPVIPGVIWK